jgi:hypothetical protein
MTPFPLFFCGLATVDTRRLLPRELYCLSLPQRFFVFTPTLAWASAHVNYSERDGQEGGGEGVTRYFVWIR